MFERSVFSEEYDFFRENVRRFLKSEAVPYHSDWEEAGIVDRDLWRKAGALGFLCPTVPETYDGAGGDFRYNTVVNEEVSRLGLSGVGFSLHSDIVVPYILNFASEDIKKKYLPGCVSGDIITAIAMTEPGTGSDLKAVATTAVLDGEFYVVNGSKTFISNGQQADLYVVVCKTKPEVGSSGVSLILVEANTPGFSRGKNLKKIGLKSQDTSELFFDNVKIHKKNLLGEEGKGFQYLMQELPQERLNVSLASIARAETLVEETVEYVQARYAFGQPISAFQNTQFKLAEVAAEITSMRVFVDRCLELHLRKSLDPVTAAKAKLLSTELLNKVADECLQLHGGYGYMSEYPVARAFVDARISKIYGGTNEIMKVIIGRDLLGQG